jgi:hypothetical protein
LFGVPLTRPARKAAHALGFAGIILGSGWVVAQRTPDFWPRSPAIRKGIYLQDFSGIAIVFGATAPLTLTNGNTYTLTITDNGGSAGVTASITDDTGPQTVTIANADADTNAEIAFGWLSLNATPSYSFVTTISSVANT